jgi:hypothetical protein
MGLSRGRVRSDRRVRFKLSFAVSASGSRLDEAIQHNLQESRIDLRRDTQDTRLDFHKSLQVGRLQHLQKMRLARELEAGIWSVSPDLESTLRTMGERGDIIRTMSRCPAASNSKISRSVPSSKSVAIANPAKSIATSSTSLRKDCIGPPIIWPPRVNANGIPRASSGPMFGDSRLCAEHTS